MYTDMIAVTIQSEKKIALNEVKDTKHYQSHLTEKEKKKLKERWPT